VSIAALPATSREGENIFALLVKVIFVYTVKKENIRKKPHLPWCTTHRGGFFIHQSWHF